MEQVSRTSPVPLYAQIQLRLVERIQAGILKPGDLLYSERELCEMFGVSRMTARQALKELCRSGYAFSERGRGTFVSRSKVEKNIRLLTSFSEEMRARGLEPSSRVLEKRFSVASAQETEKLGLKNQEPVLRLCRLRLANEIPMALETSCLACWMCPGILEKDWSRLSLYQVLENECRIRLGWADEVLEASRPKAEEACLLEIAKSKPVLVATRVVYTMEGKPIEYVRSVYRGDRYRMLIHLSREADAGFFAGS